MNSVSFDTSYLRASRPDQWLTQDGDQVSLHFFNLRPDIGASLDDIVNLRSFYREAIRPAHLGLIETDVIEVDSTTAIRTIFKAAQNPSGRTYVGSLTFPFDEFSYVVKVVAFEHQPTGLRDTAIFTKLLSDGSIQLSDTGEISGWIADPYTPDLAEPMTMNLSEQCIYDAQFPHHPLSRVRSNLDQISRTLSISNGLKAARPFSFGSNT